jgi:hypothetical protein
LSAMERLLSKLEGDANTVGSEIGCSGRLR